jgi:predicted NACHT family NTPase
VSTEILEALRDRAAFKPKPPDYELAYAHVPLGDVGLPDPIEDRVLAAMRSEDENSVLILAPPGAGKSSLLAWAAARASERPDTPHVLPVYVPVGHHTASIDTALLVRGVAEGIAGRLEPSLNKR